MTRDEAYRTMETAWRLAGWPAPEDDPFCPVLPKRAPIIELRGGLIGLGARGDYVWKPRADEVIYAPERSHDTMPFIIPPRPPQEWINTLTAVAPDQDERCYIAGGALRDLIIGRVPKDIDIFVGLGWREDVIGGMGKVELVEDGAPIEQDPASWSKEDASIKRLYNLRRPSGLLFQIIERTDNPLPYDMLDQFDFGICRVAWSLSSGWVVHTDFLRDFADLTFTVRENRYAAATLVRAGIFAKRFPGWSFDLSAAGGWRGKFGWNGELLHDPTPPF